MLAAATLFTVIFALNVVPAFAPPTWLALSWVGFGHPAANPLVVALIGAAAATAGRVVLARLARVVIRQRILSDRSRDNVDALRDTLVTHKRLTFGIFLFYAFSPFPSNWLFIAYGLTPLALRLIAVPFFIGRWVSYSFFVFTAARVSQRLDFETPEAEPYFGLYFVLTQLLLLAVVYAFTRIDWQYLMARKRLRWLARR